MFRVIGLTTVLSALAISSAAHAKAGSSMNAQNPFRDFRIECAEGDVPTGCLQVGKRCRDPLPTQKPARQGNIQDRTYDTYLGVKAQKLCRSNVRFCGKTMLSESCCGIQCVHLVKGNTDPKVVGNCIQKCTAFAE